VPHQHTTVCPRSASPDADTRALRDSDDQAAAAYRAELAAIVADLERAGRPLPLGLSKAHISPHQRKEQTAEWAKGGKIARLHWLTGERRRVAGGPRGEVLFLTKSAARRLQYRTAELNWERDKWRPLIATLTYPRPAPQDMATIKRHLDSFIKWLVGRYPSASGMWVLESQEDGSPHYHLILFGVEFVPWRRVAMAWDRIIANPVTPEESASTQVARIRGYRGVARYISTYLKKGDVDRMPRAWGRRWGQFNKRCLPRVVAEAEISVPAFHQLRRWMLRYRESQGYRPPRRRHGPLGFTCFIDGRDFERMMRLAARGP
jgi:hypothetical protein